MSQTTLAVVIAVATFIVSVLTSAIVAATKWQKLQDKVDAIESTLSEIKGMFTMKLRD